MGRMRAVRVCSIRLLALLALLHCLVGCGDRIQLPSPEKLADFGAAGPQGPAVDTGKIAGARIPTGPYRVTRDDVLQLRMPITLYPDVTSAGAAAGGETLHTCRVHDTGLVTLPDGRRIKVVGKTLSEIESVVVDTYFPSLVKARPAVYASVLEYTMGRIHVGGAVARPGVYSLRHDQMSLAVLLMEAGGIVEGGAAVIRITRSEQDGATTDGASEEHVRRLRGEEETRRSSRSGDLSSGATETAATSSASFLEIPIRFEPEGPLRTTGWLVLEEDGAVRVRQWLDVASPYQRRAVLAKANSELPHLPSVVLDAKLSQLERTLAGGGRSAVHLTTYRSYSGRTPGIWDSSSGSIAHDAAAVNPQVVETTEADDLERSSRPTRDDRNRAMVLPVRGLNIPFTDVPLREGDSVIVERLKTQYVSVLGLVRTPGNFPYPHEVRYTLAQALGLAGGLDMIAEPRYVTVYRLRADGTVANATFQLVNPENQEELTDRLAVMLKPGDVVSVEHTPRTRTKVFLDRVFRITLGLYFRPEEMWE